MNKYETKDIWIASALFSLGYKCTAEKVNDRQFVFVFEDSEHVKKALEQYNRGRLLIDVSSLQTAYKTLKNLTFKQ